MRGSSAVLRGYFTAINKAISKNNNITPCNSTREHELVTVVLIELASLCHGDNSPKQSNVPIVANNATTMTIVSTIMMTFSVRVKPAASVHILSDAASCFPWCISSLLFS